MNTLKTMLNTLSSLNRKYRTILKTNIDQFKYYEKSLEYNVDYSPNEDYDDYENEIIEGESNIDILLEQMERNDEIRFALESARFFYEKSIQCLDYHIQKESNQRKIMQTTLTETIEKMTEIQEIEIKKVKQPLLNAIENIKNETLSFENEFKKYTIVKSLKRTNLSRKEINEIEQSTHLKCDKILFDSNNDNWSQNSSVFHEKIMGKSNIVIIIESTEREKFGVFHSSLIYGLSDKQYIHLNPDNNSFLFTFRDEKLVRFDILKRCENEALFVYDDQSDFLFACGKNDLIVQKKGLKSRVGPKIDSSFCYEDTNTFLSSWCGAGMFKFQKVRLTFFCYWQNWICVKKCYSNYQGSP